MFYVILLYVILLYVILNLFQDLLTCTLPAPPASSPEIRK
jgi:hypothetical protein